MGFDARGAADRVAEGLRPLGNPERAPQEKRYLKSELDFLGVPLPEITRVVKAAIREHQPALRHDDAWPVIDRWSDDQDF